MATLSSLSLNLAFDFVNADSDDRVDVLSAIERVWLEGFLCSRGRRGLCRQECLRCGSCRRVLGRHCGRCGGGGVGAGKGGWGVGGGAAAGAVGWSAVDFEG